MNTKLLDASAPRDVVLVRLVVGCVFLSEGIQKFLYPDALGVGRFAKIGIPAPPVLAPFVGVVEIVCGGLVLIGLLTRLAAVPLIIDMHAAGRETLAQRTGDPRWRVPITASSPCRTASSSASTASAPRLDSFDRPRRSSRETAPSLHWRSPAPPGTLRDAS